MPTFNGDSRTNNILASDKEDIINVFGGFDFLSGGFGANVSNGGEGIGTMIYEDSNESVVVFSYDVWTLGTVQGDDYNSIENLTGSKRSDVLVGDGKDNVILGAGGEPNDLYGGTSDDRRRGGGKLIRGVANDNLQGQAASNRLFGDSGDDVLAGRFGADLMDGGTGYDLLSYKGSKAGVPLSLGSGGQLGDAAGDSYVNIERVIGSSFGNTKSGDDISTEIDGRDGSTHMGKLVEPDFISGKLPALCTVPRMIL